MEAINISEAESNIDTQKESRRQWCETGPKCRVQTFRGHVQRRGTLKAFMVHRLGVRDHGFPPGYCVPCRGGRFAQQEKWRYKKRRGKANWVWVRFSSIHENTAHMAVRTPLPSLWLSRVSNGIEILTSLCEKTDALLFGKSFTGSKKVVWNHSLLLPRQSGSRPLVLVPGVRFSLSPPGWGHRQRSCLWFLWLLCEAEPGAPRTTELSSPGRFLVRFDFKVRCGFRTHVK